LIDYLSLFSFQRSVTLGCCPNDLYKYISEVLNRQPLFQRFFQFIFN